MHEAVARGIAQLAVIPRVFMVAPRDGTGLRRWRATPQTCCVGNHLVVVAANHRGEVLTR